MERQKPRPTEAHSDLEWAIENGILLAEDDDEGPPLECGPEPDPEDDPIDQSRPLYTGITARLRTGW